MQTNKNTSVFVQNSHSSDMQHLKDQVISDTANPIKYAVLDKSTSRTLDLDTSSQLPPRDKVKDPQVVKDLLADTLDQDLDAII